ncbi:MAG: hypothetical protein WAL59_06675, partial [Roseiarcus sp.]
ANRHNTISTTAPSARTSFDLSNKTALPVGNHAIMAWTSSITPTDFRLCLFSRRIDVIAAIDPHSMSRYMSPDGD